MNQTKQLELITDLFKKDKNPLNASFLVSTLKDKMNRATVYRILARLENNKIVHSFKDKDGKTWYAKCHSNCQHENKHTENHPHFQCTECGKIECVEDYSISIPKNQPFSIESQQVLWFGKCEQCTETIASRK